MKPARCTNRIVAPARAAGTSILSWFLALLAGGGCAAAASAQGTGLAGCVRGDGSYSGDLAGTCGYRVDDDDPRGPLLRLCFSGALWDLYAGDDPPLASGTSPAVFVEALVTDEGFFNSSATTYPLTGITFSAEGAVDGVVGCTIAGSWTARGPGGDIRSGTFQLAESSAGNCFDAPTTAPPTDAPTGTGAACSAPGLAVLLTGLAKLTGRRRIGSRRSGEFTAKRRTA